MLFLLEKALKYRAEPRKINLKSIYVLALIFTVIGLSVGFKTYAWASNTHTYTVKVRYENPDGTFGDYIEETQVLKEGDTFNWVCKKAKDNPTQWQAVSDITETVGTSDKTWTRTVKLQEYYFLVQFVVGDSEEEPGTGSDKSSIGTFDVYINGEKKNTADDYFNKEIKYGATYDIKNIAINDEQYTFTGIKYGNISGTCIPNYMFPKTTDSDEPRMKLFIRLDRKEDLSVLKSGSEINSIFKTLAGGDLSNIYYIHQAPEAPDTAINIAKSGTVKAWFAGESIFIYTPSTHVQYNADSSQILSGMINLKSIGPLEKWDTVNVTNFSNAFSNDKSIENLNLATWITKNVNNVTAMFQNCSNLSYIYVDPNNWSLNNVTEYNKGSDVFEGCLKLKGYDGSKIDVTMATSDGYLTQTQAMVDWNDPIKTMQDLTYGVTERLIANKYNREGYVFEGWSVGLNRDMEYKDRDNVRDLVYGADEIVQLYAVWNKNAYWVKFYKNDNLATGTMKLQLFYVDEPQELSSIGYTKTGYHFSKWTTAPDGTGESYTDCQIVNNLTLEKSGVIRLYAQWEPNDYTVHYNSNWSMAIGNMKDQKFVYDKSQALTENNFRRAGYYFNGWNTKSDLTGDHYDDKQEVINLTSEQNGVVDLYATWDTNQYTLKFNANTGNGSMDDIVCKYGQDIKLPASTFTKEANLFVGWNTEADGSGINYEDEQTVSNLTTTKDGIVTLYAQWDASTYIVQYSGNGNTSGNMQTQTLRYGVATNLLPNQFVKTGYTFKNWKVTIDGKTSTYEDKALVKNLTTERGRVITFIAQWEANGYNVVFDKNADKATGVMNPESFTYDVAQKLSTNKFKNVGYVYTGWNTKADGSGMAYADEQSVKNLASGNGDVITLYAQWTPITYKISFDANTGTGSMATITATYDKEITLPISTFKKTGYPFAGWNTNANGTGSSYIDKAKVLNLASDQDATVVLYAQWSASVYYVRFHGGDGTVGTMSDQPITYDKTQKLNPNTFLKTGYSFASWNTKENGSGTSYLDKAEVLNLTDVDDAVIDLYAQWIANQYKVSFSKNGTGVTGTMATQTHVFDTSQKLTTNTYKRRGYTFTGWNTKSDGTGTAYDNEEEVKNLTSTRDAVVTLYAQWKANAYTVDFNKNNENATGIMNPQPFTYDQSQPLTSNGFTRAGYLFDSWNTEADGTGTRYENNESVTNLTANAYGIVTLYAQWTPIQYFVRFDANSEYASGSMDRQTFIYDTVQKLTPIGYSCVGHLFNGWNTAPDGSGTAYHDEQEVKNLTTISGGTVTLYAQWQGNAYYVDFDGNGADSGSMGKQALVYDKGMTLAPNAFRKEGYHFVHWTLHADGTGLVILDEEVVVNLTDENGGTAILYAQWEPNNYQVAYNKNAGNATGTMQASTFTYNQRGYLTKNNYTRVGYTFTGWNTEKGGSGNAYADMSEIENLTSDQNGTVTLYAQWKASTYKIIYDKNNINAKGSIPDTKATYDTAFIIGKCSYTLDGYTFTEWNTKPDGTGTSYPAGMEVVNLCDKNGDKIVLYAQWTANTYSISYNKNNSKATGAMASQIFRFDATMKLSKNTYSYIGYIFDGWNTKPDGTGTSYTDEQEVTNLTSVDKTTIILYAQWKPITYTVRYHGGADDAQGVMKDQIFTYDQTSALSLNTFTKTGYQFAGWSTQKDSDVTVYNDGEIVKNLTSTDKMVVDLYAVWGGITYYIAFDGNESTGGSMSNVTMNYDVAQTLPKSTFTRYGYQFSGWNTKQDGTGAGYRDEGEVLNLTSTANETVTLYAQWKSNRYIINFDPNATDANGTMDSQEVLFGKETPLNANKFIRNGYVFAGWNLRANGTGNAYIDKQPVLNLVMIDGGEITLYAQWTPITYTVSFDSGAFDTTGNMESQIFAYNQTAALNENQFTRNGYLFEGWSLDRNDNTVMYKDKAEVVNLAETQDANVILYAKWSHSKYYVAFHGNGQTSGSMATQEFVYGDSQNLTKNGFIKTGWNFTGWNTEPDGSGESYKDEETISNPLITAGRTINLYAQWETTNSTVNYVLNGGEWVTGYTAPVSHLYDEELILPTAANIKRTGFIFLGWYENSGFTGTCYTKLPANTGDKTLYAAWYDLNGKKNGISKPIKNDYQYGN